MMCGGAWAGGRRGGAEAYGNVEPGPATGLSHQTGPGSGRAGAGAAGWTAEGAGPVEPDRVEVDSDWARPGRAREWWQGRPP